MHNVLLTGATGFLGSHIAQIFARKGIHTVSLKRKFSDTWRCEGFDEHITWIDLDDAGAWKDEVVQHKPTEIIHCAWIGVEAKDRDNWILQSKNIELLIDLLDISRDLKIDKFVFLGSQAEYGYIDAKVSENQIVNPLSAYASIKMCCQQILETFSSLNNINWIWLRVFTVFGERESENWLIPSIIKAMREKSSMDFTKGEQKYSYLYAGDFAQILFDLLEYDVKAGIYNISSNHTIELKSIIEYIREYINPTFELNFGAIPYRSNQSMHIEGDITKLTDQIGKINFTEFDVALSNTINYYLSK